MESVLYVKGALQDLWTPNPKSLKAGAGKILSGVPGPMRRGYRCVILATFGWLILAAANSPKESSPTNNASGNRITSAKAASNYSAYPGKNAENCYNADNHDSADLCAQWRAAVAAEKAANAAYAGNWIAGVGAFLSFLSIVLVVIALRQTNKANRLSGDEFIVARAESAALARDTASSLAQARRSADAAIEAVGLSRTAQALELRPWVGVIDARGMNVQAIDIATKNAEATFGFQGIIKNTGKTPAQNLECIIDHRLVPYNQVDVSPFTVEDFKGRDFENDRRPTMMLPGADGLTSIRSIRAADAADVMVHKSKVLIWIYIRYFDVPKGKLFETEACLEARFVQEILGPGKTGKSKFDINAIGPQNRMT